MMGVAVSDVLDFYDRHPISEAQVLAALRRRRGALAGGPVTADDLFAFDQDHYGGLAAVDTLARLGGIRAGTRVLDLCAGLGGPARFLASRRRCQVVALELNAGRAAGAAVHARPSCAAKARPAPHGSRGSSVCSIACGSCAATPAACRSPPRASTCA